MGNPAIQQTLLPRATIDAFFTDPATAEALRSTVEDWRMARITINTMDGGLTKAMEHYRQAPSPELVAVELDNAANDVEGAIDKLAGHCRPGTGAIVLGHTNDVRLYRRLTEMGVSDYLVGPYGPEELIGSFAKGLANVSGASGKLVAVVGAKGGVGTTSMAQAIAWLAGEKRQATSFLADMQGLGGTSGIAFGCEAKRSLDELLESIADGKFDAEMLSRVVSQVGDHIQLLPGGRGVASPDQYGFEAVEMLIAEARTLADVTIVDLPAGLHPLTRHVAAMADHVVLVTTPLLTSLRNARLLLDELKQKRGSDAPTSVLVNKQGAHDRADLPVDAIKDALEQKSVHSVPFAPNLFALAETNGKYFDNDKTTQKVLRDLAPLIDAIYQKESASAGRIANDQVSRSAAALMPASGKLGALLGGLMPGRA
ncbi:MAG: hypothetical protein KI792_10220 [Alphaproteobacteria bacterium]|nr:hypothetical protein [Alphaproteobacteria bacterium SS10]